MKELKGARTRTDRPWYCIPATSSDLSTCSFSPATTSFFDSTVRAACTCSGVAAATRRTDARLTTALPPRCARPLRLHDAHTPAQTSRGQQRLEDSSALMSCRLCIDEQMVCGDGVRGWTVPLPRWGGRRQLQTRAICSQQSLQITQVTSRTSVSHGVPLPPRLSPQQHNACLPTHNSRKIGLCHPAYANAGCGRKCAICRVRRRPAHGPFARDAHPTRGKTRWVDGWV